MVSIRNLNNLIEIERKKRGISTSIFLDSIISARSYRRYINDGKSFPFDVFVNLIERLNFGVFDFLIYAYNVFLNDHSSEYHLFDALKNNSHDDVKAYLSDIDLDHLKTDIGETAIKIMYAKYSYLNEKISEFEYKKQIDTLIPFQSFENLYVMNRDLVVAIKSSFRDFSLKQTLMLYELLKRFEEGSVRVVSVVVDENKMTLHNIFLSILLTNDTLYAKHIDGLQTLFEKQKQRLLHRAYISELPFFIDCYELYAEKSNNKKIIEQMGNIKGFLKIAKNETVSDLVDLKSKSFFEKSEIEHA